MTAMFVGDATEEETEEMHRQVRDLVNYLAKYDDPRFKKQLGAIKNPQGLIVLIQSEQKFERGSATSIGLVAVGSFNPIGVATAIRDWLVESQGSAQLGKEIK